MIAAVGCTLYLVVAALLVWALCRAAARADGGCPPWCRITGEHWHVTS